MAMPANSAAPVNVTSSIGNTLLSDTIIRYEVNQVPTAEISFVTLKETEAKDVYKDSVPGKSVTLTVGGEPIFQGIVLRQIVTEESGNVNITLKLAHPLIRMKYHLEPQLFADKNDKEIISQLIANCKGGSVSMEGMDKIKHEQIMIFESSDWDFMMMRLRASGCWLFPQPDKVIIREPALNQGKKHSLNRTNAAVNDVVTRINVDRNMTIAPKSIEVNGWHALEQKVQMGKPVNVNKQGSEHFAPAELTDSPNWHVMQPSDLTKPEADVLAHAHAVSHYGKAVMATITVRSSVDSLKYKIGDVISLGDQGFVKGDAVISGLVHHIFNGNAVTEIFVGIRRNEGMRIPVNRPMPAITGIVGEFKQDSQEMHRMQVQLPLLKNQIIWARKGSEYASEHQGFAFYPEEKDEVVLQFAGGDGRYPVISYSLHSKNRPPPQPLSKENDTKGFYLKPSNGGDGKLQQLVFDRKEESLSLKNSKEELEIKKGLKFISEDSLSLTVQKDISFEAKDNVTIQAQEKDMSVQAPKGNLSMSAKDKLSSEASAIDVKGTNSVEIGAKKIDVKTDASALALTNSGSSVTSGASKVELDSQSVSVSGTKVAIESPQINLN